jgi:hypothetical protein
LQAPINIHAIYRQYDLCPVYQRRIVLAVMCLVAVDFLRNKYIHSAGSDLRGASDFCPAQQLGTITLSSVRRRLVRHLFHHYSLSTKPIEKA